MSKKDNSGSKPRHHAPTTTDPRFARVHSDPRFLRAKRDDTKLVVDDRFKSLLGDGKNSDGNAFGINKRRSKTDRFGRKTKATSKDEEEMKRLYKLEKRQAKEEEDESGEDEEDEDGEDSKTSEEEQGKSYVDYARGGADLESSSDEDSDEDEDESSSGSSDSESDVEIGTSAALRKEKRRKAAAGESDSSEDEDEEDLADVDAPAMDPEAFAALDAQAAAAIRSEQQESDEEADDNARAGSSSRSSVTQKRKHRKREQATVPLGEETKRLAVVNMDWDHVRSLDLYKVFSSLVSPIATRLPGTAVTETTEGRRNQASVQVKGTVESVRVYVSEFGKERMKREDIEGPPKEIFKRASEDGTASSSRKTKKKNRKGQGKEREQDGSEDEDSDVVFEVDDGAEFDEEALRKYQLERLRYYYAVATFDTPQAARHVYDEIDGTEMERTANMFDLQFVPDEIKFAEHQGDDGWRDDARPGVDDGVAYKGVDWATAALRHSKVRLTWDAPDPERQKITRRANLTKDQIRDEDFKAYLASDSEPSDEEDETGEAGAGNAAHRDKMRALLGLNDEQDSARGKGRPSSSAFQDARDPTGPHDGDEEQGDMQITFMPGLSEAAGRRAQGMNGKEGAEESTLEKYLRKQREKKASRKAAKGTGEEESAKPTSSAAPQPKDSDLGFDDPFFASDNDEDADFDEMLAREQQGGNRANGKQSGQRDSKKAPKSHVDVDDAESADEDGMHRNHFSMQDIIKSEAKAGKKLNRWEKKKAAKSDRNKAEAQPTKGKPSTQDDFSMDVADPRFRAVMDDHQYAIDPSHPGFVMTSGMKKLLDEKRKRGSGRDNDGDQARHKKKLKKAKTSNSGQSEDASAMLKSLQERQKQHPSSKKSNGVRG